MSAHHDTLSTLLSRLLDGALSEEERLALSTLLASDEKAREEYVDLIATHAALRQELSAAPMSITALADTLDEAQPTTDEQASAEFVSLKTPSSKWRAIDGALSTGINWRAHPGRFAVVALALTVVFLAAFFAIVWPRFGEEEVAPGVRQRRWSPPWRSWCASLTPSGKAKPPTPANRCAKAGDCNSSRAWRRSVSTMARP